MRDTRSRACPILVALGDVELRADSRIEIEALFECLTRVRVTLLAHQLLALAKQRVGLVLVGCGETASPTSTAIAIMSLMGHREYTAVGIAL